MGDRALRSPLCWIVIGLVAAACSDDIPGPPSSLSISPSRGPQGQATPVTIRGRFEALQVRAGYPKSEVTGSLEAFLGDEPLLETTLIGDGAIRAIVPDTLAAGLYPLIVVDGRGREGRLDNAFRILGPADRIARFTIGTIGDGEINVAFSVTLTALDIDGNIVSDFAGIASIRDRTGTIFPSRVGPFFNGAWTGEVTIRAPSDDDVLTVSAGTVTSDSNSFRVLCPGSCTCLEFFADTDADGYGDGTQPYWACTAPVGHVAEAGDCDDSAPTVYPSAPEVAADGIDQNCDGVDDCYHDGDSDGYGGPTHFVDDDLDCSNGSSGETAVGGDCDDGNGAIHPGVSEIVDDGIDQDCDGGDRCYEDLDGDGYGTTNQVNDNDTDCSNGSANEADNTDDCDDGVPTCTLSCTDNTDGDVPPVPDCVEQFCGTDPASAGDTCILADGTTTTLEDAIASANATGGFERIAVTYSPSLSSGIVINSGDGACLGLRVAAGERITVATAGVGLTIEDDGCSLEGLDIVGATTGVVVSGSNSTLRDLRVMGFADEGVRMTGAANQLLDSTIHGCVGPSSGARAGVAIASAGGGVKPDGNVIADNLIVNNDCAAVQLRSSPDGTRLDHNTIAFNSAGVTFVNSGAGAKNVCMRSNLVTDNAGGALEFDKAPTFDESTACVGPLAAGPIYGNGHYGNTLGACGTGACADCACLPTGSFWSHQASPAYVETDATATTAFCLGEPSLVDQGSALGYDLNGAQADDFTGTAPDIGARESGAGGCPTL